MINNVKTRKEFVGEGFKVIVEYVENLCSMDIQTNEKEIVLTLKQNNLEIECPDTDRPVNISEAKRRRLGPPKESP